MNALVIDHQGLVLTGDSQGLWAKVKMIFPIYKI